MSAGANHALALALSFSEFSPPRKIPLNLCKGERPVPMISFLYFSQYLINVLTLRGNIYILGYQRVTAQLWSRMSFLICFHGLPFRRSTVPQFQSSCLATTELFSYYYFFCLGTSCGVRTKDGNAYGGCCVFPFKYNGVMHYTCTYLDHNMPWCSITMNYDRDGVWGECIGTYSDGDAPPIFFS